jgi:hypothetical protein
MSKYPRLTEMGVRHPEQIDSYSISSVGYVDNLRITYVRPKGSLLPKSRSYQFPRVQKTAVVNPDKGDSKVVMESDPAFREAVAELRELLEKKSGKEDLAGQILREIAALEEDIAARSGCIRELAEKLKRY